VKNKIDKSCEIVFKCSTKLKFTNVLAKFLETNILW